MVKNSKGIILIVFINIYSFINITKINVLPIIILQCDFCEMAAKGLTLQSCLHFKNICWLCRSLRHPVIAKMLKRGCLGTKFNAFAVEVS